MQAKNPDHQAPPMVESEEDEAFYSYCTLAGDRLEDGPDNFDDYYGVAGALYTDYTFYDREQLYWEGHSSM